MIVIHGSAIDALRKQEKARRVREDRMRNALEILAHAGEVKIGSHGSFERFVRATAREGLGRET